MEAVLEFESRILYYCRQGYYHEMQEVSEHGLKRFTSESSLKLFHALALLLQNKMSEGLRELEGIQKEAHISLAVNLAAIVAHKSFNQVDKEAVASLEATVKQSRKAASANELYFAGLLLELLEKPEKGREYLDRAIKAEPNHLPALSARGWTEIKLIKIDKGPSTPEEYFSSVLKENRKHLDSLLGLAAYLEMCHDFFVSMEKLNQILAMVPNWLPALMEKMKVSLSSQDWEQSSDLATRIISVSSTNLEAHRLHIIHHICREGNLEEGLRGLKSFFSLCCQKEPFNGRYFIENARLFSQLVSYNYEILSETIKFARFAADLDPGNAEYVADVGKIYLLMGKVKEACQEFKTATSIDSASVSALYGLISCQLAQGDVETASQQLDFLTELAKSVETPSELYYLRAVMAKIKNQSAESTLKCLNEALEAHFAKMRGLPFNISYLKAINPHLVISIVKEYLAFAPQEPAGVGTTPPACVRQASMILETVTKICPSHRDALFISGKVHYLKGDFRTAIAILNQVQKIDPALTDVYLLLAQVHVAQDELELASQALDNGLSCNFKVREHPKYHLLLATVQRHKGELEKPKKTLETAFSLLKPSLASESPGMFESGQGHTTPVEFTMSDRVSLYLELASVHRALGNTHESSVIMQQALEEFKGTHVEGRIELSQAEELVERGEVDKALHLLRVVQPSQAHFVESRKLMAHIYLNYHHNPELYTSCFMEITNYNPSPQNLLLLADAYMNIQEPDKAIEIYEIALAKNPRDATLASKMGQALVLTHQYSKAINYYKEAVKNDDNFSLRLELASLHMKLKQWEKAEKVVQQALSDCQDDSLSGLLNQVQLLVLLAKVQKGSGNMGGANQSLIRAKESQSRAIKRSTLERPSGTKDQKAQFSLICRLLGDVAESQSEKDFAIRSLKEALEQNSQDWQCLIAIARLYMEVGDHIHCQQACQQLLKVKGDCPEASVMLGELFFRKHDFQSASFHFQQFLERLKHLAESTCVTNVASFVIPAASRWPTAGSSYDEEDEEQTGGLMMICLLLDNHSTHWSSLMWFVECSRRCGKLSEAEGYLVEAGNAADPNDPGLGYCQGLYEWYSGNTNAALKMLNKARKDTTFSKKALWTMIDIYLNPTGGVLGGDTMAAGDSSIANGSSDKNDVREYTLNTADTLINELSSKTREEKFKKQVLEGLVLISSKQKGKVEKGIQDLTEIGSTDLGRDSIMLVYALATGYMVLKQTPRARNQLKRVMKATWTVDDAEYLERCWILLADLYIQSSKYDMATDLIKRVLTYNKSCGKANEYLGYIMEKEQTYLDAAVNYSLAWNLTNKNNPALGYKLAFNYLKAKRFTDAIDVCHIVLEKYPHYPKIKKDIMDKARANLRP